MSIYNCRCLIGDCAMIKRLFVIVGGNQCLDKFISRLIHKRNHFHALEPNHCRLEVYNENCLSKLSRRRQPLKLRKRFISILECVALRQRFQSLSETIADINARNKTVRGKKTSREVRNCSWSCFRWSKLTTWRRFGLLVLRFVHATVERMTCENRIETTLNWRRFAGKTWELHETKSVGDWRQIARQLIT